MARMENQPVVQKDRPLARHPQAFYLDADDRPAMTRYLRDRGWIDIDETVESAAKPGDGNMNCTLRVVTGRRRLIVKQARPWVEKYDQIPAPWDRALVEARFYETVADTVGVSQRMPRLLGVDPASRVLALEDLGDRSRDLSDLYGGGTLADAELEALVAFLCALHGAALDPAARAALTNRAMRALNHEYIFELPLAADGAVDLEALTPGLGRVAEPLTRDAGYRRIVAELGQRYLADGSVLVHGDYFPGSWLRTGQGVKVIDPEFCFVGDPAFDLGVCAAHLIMASQPATLPVRLLEAYERQAPAGWDADARRRTLQFAGVEIMRRLIGVAQLPLRADLDRKAGWLERSRHLVLEPAPSLLS